MKEKTLSSPKGDDEFSFEGKDYVVKNHKAIEKEKTLNNKKIWINPYNYFKYEDVKEFIKKRIELLVKKYAKEKTTHKNHRVQALLIELKTDLEESAGKELSE